MEQRLGRKKYKIYAFDIESHNDLESIIRNKTSMWLGSFIDENSKEDDEASYLYDMDEFLNRLENLSNPKRSKDKNEKKPIKNICVYIYNLSFERSFILPYLLKRGFKFKETFDKGDEYVYNSVSTRSCSSVWLVNLKFSKNGGQVIFRDLAKIFGGGLGKVAKSFGLPTQKGEIDYRAPRTRPIEEAKIMEEYLRDNWEELKKNKGEETRLECCKATGLNPYPDYHYIPTEEEKIYCFKDTRIIIDILIKLKDDKIFWKSSSMASYSMNHLLKRGWPKSYRPYKEYRKLYPELGKEESEFLRAGVGGGICYCPKLWQFKEITQPVAHIDAHQFHPTQAYTRFFGYGEGEYFKGKPTRFIYHINACRIRVSYTGVRLHSCIKLIGLEFVEGAEIVVRDFEIPTMFKCYENFRVEYIDGYSYKCKKLPRREYYADNYRKRLIAKKNHDDFNVLYYKLLNNSSYGKHLEKPHNLIIQNYINPEGIIDSLVENKEVEEINAKYTYLPIGSAIPAYSRVSLIETALKFGWENITYFDTDSIFFIWNEKTKAILEKEIDLTDFLGGWELVEIIDRAQFAAPKRYKTEVNGKTDIKAGGINFEAYKAKRAQELNVDKYDIPFDEVNIISSQWEVQRAYRVEGGTIIEFQTKEMKVAPKYLNNYEKNTKI